MVILAPILYFGWKLIKRTKAIPSSQVDLVWDAPVIDQYEASLLDPPTGFWQELGNMFRLGRRSNKSSV